MHGDHQREGSELMVKMMTKEIGALVVEQNPPGTFNLGLGSNEGWKAISTGDSFYNEQILDLSGLSQQEKTIFFNGIAQQDSFNPAVINGAAGDSIKVLDLISTVPVNTDLFSLARLFQYQNFSFTNFAPSVNLPTFEQTPYFSIREFTVDLDTANWGSMVLVSQNQLGSLQPTASDRLYCYRLVVIPNTSTFAATRFDVLPVRFVIGVNPMEEKEYQYLMRLKKSYDLQQSFDVDGNRPH